MTHPALGTPRQGPSGTTTRPLLVGLRHRSLGGDPRGRPCRSSCRGRRNRRGGRSESVLVSPASKPGAVGAPRAPATPLPSGGGQDKRRGGPQGPTGTSGTLHTSGSSSRENGKPCLDA